MISTIRLASILALYLIPTSTASCPGFKLGTTTCNSGIFSRSTISASCADDGKVAITGTVTAPSDFDDAEVTFVPCIRSTGVCFDDYGLEGGNICDFISSSDGSDCGSAGIYTIDQEFDIPEEVTDHSWLMRLVTIRVLINDEEACTQNATTTASSSAFMATGMASLFAVGSLSLYFMRRRKRPLVVLSEESYAYYADQHVGRFVQMNDLSPSISSVGNAGGFSVAMG
eukprot:CAMPEP_0168172220 /NCGR_PEP_ID=MMETSP0139_2-20121125/5120_1 /TAXON_ID=44445 /ORGANISM="Pseudo-nitzschia australis, Strain 10249 10 AB" /LENGTH=227 /DNA_ID=CAMNT_0008089821 /DNA_START=40 /DNA_END=723 /DNA_ORIENTATION=+